MSATVSTSFHRHALERLADVFRSGHWVRVAVRPLRVDVDQAHVVGAEGSLEFSIAIVASVVKPCFLRPPVGLVSFPNVRASEGETEGLETQRL